MFYSPSQNQWFAPEFRADYERRGAWPADAKEYPRSVYDSMMNRPVTMVMEPDANGEPVLVAAPVETQAQALDRALVEIRTQRAPMLDALVGIAGRAMRLSAPDTATAQAADAAAVDLLNITQLPALLAATTFADMKTAVMTEYRRIAGNAPTSVQSAFTEVLG